MATSVLRDQPDTSSRAGADRGLLLPVLSVLVGAALAELILQRTFYRVGIFIPKRAGFEAVYRAGTVLGSFAFNLASVLVALGLLMIALRLVRSARGATAGLVVALVVLGLVARAFPDRAAAAASYRALFIVTALAAAIPSLRRGPRATRAATAGLLAAFGCSAYYGLASAVAQLAGAAGTPAGAAGALTAGEVVVVALGPVLFLAWRGMDRSRAPWSSLAWAAVPAGSLLAAELLRPHVTGILVIWTVGLSFALPAALYAVSFWLFAAAAIGLLRNPETRARGFALVLLMVGGYFPQTTYEFMIGAAALLLWSGATEDHG